MAQQYYFFKTMKVGGRQRLRPLPGQTEPSGRHINESLNVQADSRMREDYPLGTVFCSESLELRSLLFATSFSLFFRKVISLPILVRDYFSGVLF